MVLASLTSSLIHQVALHGVYAIFLLMALDAVFPAGSEVVMVFAGAIAAGAGAPSIHFLGGRLGPGLESYLVLSTTGTLGYLVGSALGWIVGYRGGTRFLSRYGRWVHLNPGRVEQAERWFKRWGTIGILVGRVVPLVRSFISIPAGAFRMSLLPYLGLTLIGSAVWCFGLAGVGWALGSSYGSFDKGFAYVEYAVIVAVVVAVVVPLIAHWRGAHSKHP